MGPFELGIIVIIGLFLFGAGRIAAVGNGLGRATREFERGREEAEEQ
ncbi:hypothetical protein C471_09445 [Halorubrum saccharovorum DSM 1137]|uniref:Twin-arginine translocation protein, TatA/E family subunit n=1 Tax=Halorubrum saccharovorum DSM 1137 TaxID=1227484 RepID=M0DXG8_9EURY|nr:twin-arginine translocase TatA/TatE family subunit [Halorubrum saccharovorum]ELZ38784.1 hypothetical protein C471_09445 [Halorubrum saccharovorum DSM 1137]